MALKCAKMTCVADGEYGFEDFPNELFCSDHRLEGMVQIREGMEKVAEGQQP